MLEPLARPIAYAPELTDHTAARIAAASLTGDRETAAQLLDQLEAELEQERSAAAQSASGGEREILERERARTALLPLAIDLANAAAGDPRSYRAASRELLRRPDLNAGHRARLEQAVDDDPLRLADKRIREGYESLFAQTFNTVSAPLGRALITGFVTAPFTIAMSSVQYIARMIERPPVDVRERQALGHWRRFLERYPDALEADDVRERADATQRDLDRMHLERFASAAERALEADQPVIAHLHAERARQHAHDDALEEVETLLAKIERRAAEREAERSEALAASPDAPLLDLRNAANDALLAAVWLEQPEHLGPRLRSEIARAPEDPLADELEFALATTQIERGAESASWERLDSLARADPERSNMARHAGMLVFDAWQNPHQAFQRELVRGRGRAVSTEVLGSYASGPRYRALPEELAYLIDAPFIAQRALSTPFRMLLSPLDPTPRRDHKRAAAVAGYRYVDRFPDGEHRRSQVQWLFEYEDERGNALAALRLADAIPDFDPERRLELAERAADQQLERAVQAGRRDQRAQMLHGVALDFPDSLAGRSAGQRARSEADEATPQRIRLTRGFLRENPWIAGSRGLAIEPTLTDGEVRNGELHPRGVTFLGGRILEIALIPRSGDEDDEPELVRTQIGAARLARSVALVEESATLGVRLDKDDEVGVDGGRDQYFERARLGLTNDIDPRPTAESTYVYQGMAERYGLVRGRDSILPFDLVVQGSVQDLGIGAFPRWREPELTPDAFLYR
jgi:hypothetical protein